MPTSKVTNDFTSGPDIFITGNVPAAASDDLLGAHSQAPGQPRRAAIPPRFGDVMRHDCQPV